MGFGFSKNTEFVQPFFNFVSQHSELKLVYKFRFILYRILYSKIVKSLQRSLLKTQFFPTPMFLRITKRKCYYLQRTELEIWKVYT